MTLYNGIELPVPWPPKRDGLTREPMPVPYLQDRPAVVPIDLGRQLFVDDFLIERTTLTRTFHAAEYHAVNPVLAPDQPWEPAGDSNAACPYSGGVWYDPADKLFKMWYSAGNEGWINRWLSYATSADGVTWRKPALDGIELRSKALDGSNVVLDVGHTDSTTVWLDPAADPSERFKYFATEKREGWHYTYRASADGVRWSEPIAATPMWGDRTTTFYNPFRKVWCLSQRIHGPVIGRARAYLEDADPKRLVEKIPPNERMTVVGDSVYWANADDLDPPNPVGEFGQIKPELYNLDAAAYESLMLGLFTIWTGPENHAVAERGLQKRCDVLVAFSRDGFHWDRPSRQRFIAASWDEGLFNYGNIQSAGGGCLIVGEKLYVYVSARAKDATGLHGRASTGLAILRRDGFASMDADAQGGILTTRPVTFTGAILHVNVDCPTGELRVDVLAEDGAPIEPFTPANCNAVSADTTCTPVTWNGADLATLAGQTVRFRFYLTRGKLYAFWVSPDASGPSHGYVAAGGPGLAGPTDTIGQGNV